MSAAKSEHNSHILYEFPLNERFRTYLRLEALYRRWCYLLVQNSEHAHHSAVITLFEMYEFAFRHDLKGDLLTEITRYHQLLNRFRNAPDLCEDKLNLTLLNLADAKKQIEASAKFGSALSDNDWLASVKTRIVVVGGVCSFDVPFYHQWLQQSADARRQDLQSWLMPMMPLFDALKLILLIVRDSHRHKSCITIDKAYQQALNNTVNFDLIQVKTPTDTLFIPDISANKHVIWLRFTQPTFKKQPRPMYVDIVQPEILFELNLCGI